MLKLPLALIVMLAVSCGGPTIEPVAPGKDFSPDEKIQELVDRKYEAARDNPGSAKLHRGLGLAYLANGAAEKAAASLGHSLALNPEDPEARWFLALAKGESSDADGKLEELKELVKRHSTFAPAFYELGNEYLERDELDLAGAQFKVLKALQKTLPHGSIGLGEVALARGQGQAALGHLLAAQKLGKDDKYVAFLLGKAYLEVGQEERASALLDLGADSGRPKLSSPAAKEVQSYKVGRGAQLGKAVDHLNGGDFHAALRIFEDLRERDPEDTVCLNNMAVAYMRTSQFPEAIEVLDKTLEIKPDQHESYANRASCRLQQIKKAQSVSDLDAVKDYSEKALADIDEALTLSPRFGRAYSFRGRILEAIGRGSEAINAMRMAVTLGETSEEQYMQLARFVAPVDGEQAAIQILREGVEKGGARLELNYHLCGMLLEAGQGKEARIAHARMVEMSPKAEATRKMDQILANQGF